MYRYCRHQSHEVSTRRTLPLGTLLLVDSDDRCLNESDATRPVLALDRLGAAFYLPRSSVRQFDDASQQSWFFPVPLSPYQATVFVAARRQNGCFVVYQPTLDETFVEGRPEYVLAVGLSQGETQISQPSSSYSFNTGCQTQLRISN